MLKAIGGLVVLVVIIAALADGDSKEDGSAGAGSSDEPSRAATARVLDKNSRAYLNQISTCQIAVGLVILRARDAATDVQLADETAESRDICDAVRLNLVGMDDGEFEDAATTGFYAVDRYKSGLNAILTYIDNPVPRRV